MCPNFQRLLRELFYSHSHHNQPVNIKKPQDTVLHHNAAGLTGTSCSKEYFSMKWYFALQYIYDHQLNEQISVIHVFIGEYHGPF